MSNRGRPSRRSVYRRLERALAELNDRYGGLPTPREAKGIWDDIWHQEAHNSTALEGNTLALREVEALLDQGRAVGAKPLREYNEVRGYADAARWVYGQALEPGDWHDGQLVSVTEVRQIHHTVMTPAWDVMSTIQVDAGEAPGNFRAHDIQMFAGGMRPPSWTLVPGELADWVAAVCDLGRCVSGLGEPLPNPLPEELARIHNEFERIHPFIDGNGRVGRLVLNLVLVRLGYPPVIIFKRQRDAYLNALHKADNGDFGPLGELMARAMYDNLNRFIVPNVAGPARLVPLASLVDAEFTLAALRQAAQRGRLEAVQSGDGVWMSSRRAVEEYRRNKNRRATPSS